ncbi:hypothetical protein [Desulfosporosinus sp. FKB]|uniref:hypothetical protein n=1 Tax=Desulfosporosinus sp. FKB TaxID=1969835 RepID=UPI000B49A499|nr:hypothetical protein [Desulfosporosinus sp. FKB]
MNKKNNLIKELFSSFFIVIICLLSISPFIGGFFILTRYLLNMLMRNFVFANFVSLLLSLIVFAYLPDKILDYLSVITGILMEADLYRPKGYIEGSVVVRVITDLARLRLRFVVYFIAFILALFTNLKECGFDLIRSQYINDYRTAINGAILTFIVFDRMVNEYRKLQEKEDEPTP